MKRIINPGYSGSPPMSNSLYQSIDRYGDPTPPITMDARILDVNGNPRVTDGGNTRITDM